MKALFCYSIGHSNRSVDSFLEVLAAHGVDCVADVRSAPYSRRHPQFNRESLKTDLQLAEIDYRYFGDRLGARHSNPSVLSEDGHVDFSRVRCLPAFQEGIAVLLGLIDAGRRLALMCAEKDPFNCHRFVLVSRELAAQGVAVSHIVTARETRSHPELEHQLLTRYGLHRYQPGLFEQPRSRDDLLAEAYARRNREIAYCAPESRMPVQQENSFLQ